MRAYIYEVCCAVALLISGVASAQDADGMPEAAGSMQAQGDAQNLSEAMPGLQPEARSAVTDAGAGIPAVQEETPAVSGTVIHEAAPAQVVSDQGSAEGESYNPQYSYVGWNTGFKFYLGLGPSLDLVDKAMGYSARLGFDVHLQYFGIGLEVAWNMIWALRSARRGDCLDMAYRTTNTSFLLIGNGYIPINNNFIISLGAGVGIGKRYELIYSDADFREDGTSWSARLQVGVVWRADNDTFYELTFPFDFGNFVAIDNSNFRWSDLAQDIAFGLVFVFGYQAAHHEKCNYGCGGSGHWDDDD